MRKWIKSIPVVVWVVTGLFAVYFPIAWWLKASYVPVPVASEELPAGVVRLARPYAKFQSDGFAFIGRASTLRSVADTSDTPQRSPAMLYEDGKPLGPPHSVHADISKLGLGRFSHWDNAGFIFSSSDNSDPNLNGRKYWAVLPKE
jgi:hypothetical protein